MHADLDRVLIEAPAIAQRVAELARQVLDEWKDAPGGTPEITPVPLMTGSFIFAADLIRHMPQMMQIQLMSVSSYPGTATTSQGVHIDRRKSNVPDDLTGRHVLVIDDILDSGSTLRAVTEDLRSRNPEAIKTCVLLRKQRPEAMAFPVDHVAFDIPDEFVVGYGLDYNGYYRNLPDIGVLSEKAIEAHRL